MASLANQTISSTYDGLVKTSSDNAVPVSGVQALEDGSGNALALSVGRSGNGVSVSGNLAVDTNTLYVDAANNRVGVGISSPAVPLHTVGESLFEGRLQITSATPEILFSVPSGGLDSRIHNDGSGNFIFGTGTNSSTPTERMRIDSSGTVKLDTGGILQFAANTSTPSYGVAIHRPAADSLAFVTASSEAMRIDSSGNVGIGTNSNSYTASGRGNLNIAGSGGAILGFQIGGTAKGYVFHDNTNLQLWNESAGSLLFATSGTERMRITSGGLVNFGSETLSFNSNGVLNIFNSSTKYGIGVRDYYNTSQLIVFINASDSVVGSITQTGSSTSYNITSDYRLKENVVEMTGALDRVDALKPSRFNFIADPETTVDGFLAHEVAEVVPEAITGEKDAVDEEGNPIYQGIDQSKLTPLLTAALKEAHALIKSLEARIEILENK